MHEIVYLNDVSTIRLAVISMQSSRVAASVATSLLVVKTDEPNFSIIICTVIKQVTSCLSTVNYHLNTLISTTMIAWHYCVCINSTAACTHELIIQKT